MNNVSLVGRLTKDVELRKTQGGTSTASFTLAVNRPFRSQSGDQEADFIRIVVWNKAAENCNTYLAKGKLCGVDGRIQTRNYEDKSGNRVYMTEVVANHVEFLEPKSGGNDHYSRQNQPKNDKYDTDYPGKPFDDPFAGSEEPIHISDDDLPF